MLDPQNNNGIIRDTITYNLFLNLSKIDKKVHIFRLAGQLIDKLNHFSVAVRIIHSDVVIIILILKV